MLSKQPAVAASRPPRGSGEPAVLVAPGSLEGDTSQRQYTGQHQLESHATPHGASAAAASTHRSKPTEGLLAPTHLTALTNGMPTPAAQPSASAAPPGRGQDNVAAAHRLVAEGQPAADFSGLSAILASAAALAELAGQPVGAATSAHHATHLQTHMAQAGHPSSPLTMSAAAHGLAEQQSVRLDNVEQAIAGSNALPDSNQPAVQPAAVSDGGVNGALAYGLNTQLSQAAADRGHVAAAGGRRHPAGIAAHGGQQPDGQAAGSSTLRGINPDGLHVEGVSSSSMGVLGQSIDFSKVVLLLVLLLI